MQEHQQPEVEPMLRLCLLLQYPAVPITPLGTYRMMRELDLGQFRYRSIPNSLYKKFQL